MINNFELYSNVEKVIIISRSTNIENAKMMLDEENAKFILITSNSMPISLVSKEFIKGLESNQDISKLECSLPSLLMADKPLNTLDIEDLKQYFKYINKVKADGIILCKDSKISGVLSKETIAACLEKKVIYRGLCSLPGTFNSPTKGFICKKCIPPTYRFPREGHNPTCPKNPVHGKMDYLK